MVRFGGFEIVRELGRGTTGIVYEVWGTKQNRRLALKVLSLGPESERAVRCQRFLRECQAVAAFGPRIGIPVLHGVGEFQGQPFCVRDLVDGATLEQRAQAGSIDRKTGLTILAEVARIVQRVHDRGIVHRNLSAANVLVAHDETAWLIGFGRCGPLNGPYRVMPGAPGLTAEVDVQGLQGMLGWLCAELRKPVPAGLERILAPGSLATPGEWAEALACYLRSGQV
jgi:serine/threonine protein kinase